MPLSLTVNGVVYQYPISRDPPGWGDQATLWASAVTNALTSVVAPNDIVPSLNVTIGNNVTSFTNVPGLIFAPLQIRGAIVEYSVYRVVTGSTPAELVEVGHLYISYKSIANTWDITAIGSGDAGMTFAVNSSGQIQYKSSNLTVTGGTHTGVMKFRARALNQT